MSQRISTSFRPAARCRLTSTRKQAPRGYLSTRHDAFTRRHPRSFSTSPSCAAGFARQIKASQQSQPSQPSIGVQRHTAAQKAMRAGQIPEDLGLLPQTFVMPFGKQRPSWTANWKARYKLERTRWLCRLIDVYTYASFWYYMRRPTRTGASLLREAKATHAETFTKFARGDLRGLEKKLCPGMLQSLQRRIDQRPPNTAYLWHLHRHISEPQLVSYKMFPFPETVKWPKKDRHGIAQAIVRIHSLQSLTPVKKVRVVEHGKAVEKEFEVDDAGVEVPRERVGPMEVKGGKETVEYLVLQQIYKALEPGPWKVWGMTEETTVDKIDALEKLQKQRKERSRIEKAAA